jgi:hypothetical protein
VQWRLIFIQAARGPRGDQSNIQRRHMATSP